MKCDRCGRSIDTLADYYSRHLCIDCHRAYRRTYMRKHYRTEQYRSQHRITMQDRRDRGMDDVVRARKYHEAINNMERGKNVYK